MSQIMVLLVLTDDGARFSGPILLTRSKEHYPRLLAIKTVGIGCCSELHLQSPDVQSSNPV